MKKILIALSVLLIILAGCKKKYEPDTELIMPLRSAVMNYLNNNGYDENSEYLLWGPYTENDKEFPRGYELRVNGKAVLGVYCDYADEMFYGGVNFPYKNGYLSVMADPDVLNMISGWKTENNSINVKEWFFKEKGIVIDAKDRSVNDEMINKIKQMLQDSLKTNPDKIHAGDKISVYGPIVHYYPIYSAAEDLLHLFQQDFLEFFVAVNDQFMFSANYDPASESVGTAELNSEYSYIREMIPLLQQAKSFILLHPEKVITPESQYDENLLPVLTRKAMKTAIEEVTKLDPYKCICKFTIEDIAE